MYCMKEQAVIKLKNIHCEVQVILLQKSWYIMRGSAVLVMYSMQSASKNKNEKYTL